MALSTSAEKERAITRAIEAVMTLGMKPHQAHKIFGVPRSTLYNRLNGTLPRTKAQAANQLLTPAQVSLY
jgi:predicted transcriptional regulator